MKFSIWNSLVVFLLIGLGLALYLEHRRASQLHSQVERLRTYLGPDYFAYAYHPDPNRSLLPSDPLAAVDDETEKLFRALIEQPQAWETGLNQYLGIDRLRSAFEPEITMSVWWHKTIMDSDGNKFFVYFADRERARTQSSRRMHRAFSAYIVTDANHRLTHWNGCDIDRSYVSNLELLGKTFPAALRYSEASSHNGDSSIETRKLTKSGIVE